MYKIYLFWQRQYLWWRLLVIMLVGLEVYYIHEHMYLSVAVTVLGAVIGILLRRLRLK